MGFHGKQIQPGTIDMDRLYTTGYTPVAANDLTTVAYVQALSQGLFPKTEARAKAIGDINIASPPAIFDGVNMVNGDRVVLTDQIDPTENGLYTWNLGGLTRTLDGDGPGDLKLGTFIYIEEGTVWGGFGFFISGTPSTPPNIDIGTDPIIFSILQKQSDYSATNGITLTGNVFSLGGQLSSDVDIDGQGLHRMSLSNLVDFEISTPAIVFKIDQGGAAMRIENVAATEVYLDITDDWRFNLAMDDGGGPGQVNASYSVNLAPNGVINDTHTVNAATNSSFAAGSKYSFAAGRNHVIGSIGTHGDSSTSFGIDTINDGEAGITSGVGSQLLYVANQRGGIVHGLSVGTGLKPVGVPYVTASAGAVNISRNTAAQTIGYGAIAQDSVILGGYDHHIPVDSPGSAIIGGAGIIARSTDPNQVYVPNLNIITQPVLDNAIDELLVRDVVTGQVKYREASSLVLASITASNGLTIASNEIRIGGTLLQTTNIDVGAFGFELSSTDVAGYVEFNLSDGLTTTTTVLIDYDTFSYQVSDVSNSFGVSVSPNGGIITVTGSNPGLRYAADYSSTYTIRSLVDKEYVDTAILNGPFWPLGGSASLTSNVLISSGDGYAYQLSTTDSLGDLNGAMVIAPNQILIGLNSSLSGSELLVTALSNGDLTIENTNASGASVDLSISNAAFGIDITGITDNHTIDFTETNGLVVQTNRVNGYTTIISDGAKSRLAYYDTTATTETLLDVTSVGGSGTPATIRVQSSDPLFGGITYAANYSANYSNRSLVDKEYVDDLMSSGNFWPLSGSENLLGNVTIDGTTSYSVSLLQLTDFQVTVVGATSSIDLTASDGGTSGSIQVGHDGSIVLSSQYDIAGLGTLTLNNDGEFLANGFAFYDFSTGTAVGPITYSTNFRIDQATGNAAETSATSVDSASDNLTEMLVSNWSLGSGFQMYRQRFSDIQPDSLYANFNLDINDVSISIYDQAPTGKTASIGVSNSIVNADYTPYAVAIDNSNNTVRTALRLRRVGSGTGTTNPNAVGIGGRLDYELLIGPVQQVVSGAIDNIATAVGAGWETQFIIHVGDTGTLTPVMEIDKYGAKHSADYSANYTARSLVDKAYVDAAVAGGVTASNGLTEVSGDIRLGGALTANTVISGAFSLNFANSSVIISAVALPSTLNFTDGTVTSTITHVVGGRFEINTPIGYIFNQGGIERLRIGAGGAKHVVANLAGDDNAGLITFSSGAANAASSDFTLVGHTGNILNRIGALMYSAGSNNIALGIIPGASSPAANLLSISSNNLTNYDGYMATISYQLTSGALTGSTSKPMLRIIKAVASDGGFDHTGAFIEMLNDNELTGDYIRAWDGTNTHMRIKSNGDQYFSARAIDYDTPFDGLITNYTIASLHHSSVALMRYVGSSDYATGSAIDIDRTYTNVGGQPIIYTIKIEQNMDNDAGVNPGAQNLPVHVVANSVDIVTHAGHFEAHLTKNTPINSPVAVYAKASITGTGTAYAFYGDGGLVYSIDKAIMAYAMAASENYGLTSRGRLLIGTNPGSGTGGMLQINTATSNIPANAIEVAAGNNLVASISTNGNLLLRNAASALNILFTLSDDAVLAADSTNVQIGRYAGNTELAILVNRTFRIAPTGTNYTDPAIVVIGNMTEVAGFKFQVDGDTYLAGDLRLDAPGAGTASDDVLVRDATTGLIKTVTQASIGGGGSIPAPQEDDRDMVPAVTSGDEEPTGLTITNTPTGLIIIALNGEIKSLGNGVKTKHCYFSGDGGVTARAFSAIVAGDELYWNGVVAGYDLEASDVIDFYYI